MNSAMAFTGIICAIAAAIGMWLLNRPCSNDHEQLKADYRNVIAESYRLRAEAGELESQIVKMQTVIDTEHALRRSVTVNRDKFKADYERVLEVNAAVRPSWMAITIAKMKRANKQA